MSIKLPIRRGDYETFYDANDDIVTTHELIELANQSASAEPSVSQPSRLEIAMHIYTALLFDLYTDGPAEECAKTALGRADMLIAAEKEGGAK